MNICFKKKYVEKTLLYDFLTEKVSKCRDKQLNPHFDKQNARKTTPTQ